MKTTDSDPNLIKVVIKAQTWEFYGDEDHIGEEGYGRYKAKGGAEFTTWVPSNLYWYETDKIKEAFDKAMYVSGELFMYNAVDVELFYQPKEITLDF